MLVSSMLVPLDIRVQGDSTGAGQEMVNAADAEAPAVTVTLRGFSPSTAQLVARPASATV
jgi:hypothetical protein